MEKVLVTGANGYIGRHIVKTLLDQGYKVDACDLHLEGVDERANKVATPIFNGEADIYDKLGRPDICIHMAWRNGFVHNSETHIEDLYNHYRFLSTMISGGLKHVSVMGTMHEIGYFEGAIDENTPTNPSSLYGIAKNSLRQAMQLLVKDNEVVLQWLRAYYITGDDLKSNSIFSKIVKKELEGAKNFPFTTGKNKYDFISIDDLAKQIVAASTQTKVSGVVNCCSGKPISLAERVEEFIKANNFKIKLQYGVFPDRKYDSPAIWGDNTKIQEILNHNIT